MPEVIFTGPAGRIEGRYHPAKQKNAPLAIVLHPHPQFGGTMNNKVVYNLHYAFYNLGFTVLRFNFRGVGHSEGRYDAGAGELEDALAVIDWTRRRLACDRLWLAGFSFGAAVALQAATRGARPARLVTIAPPVGRIIIEPVARPDCPWLIVHGGRDELVEAEAVRDWAAGYDPAPELAVVPDAEHFFHGRLPELRAAILAFLGAV